MIQDKLKNIKKQDFADFLGISRQALYLRIKNNKISNEEIELFTNREKSYNIIEEKNEQIEKLKEEVKQLKNIIIEIKREKEKKASSIHSEKEYQELLHRYQRIELENIKYKDLLVKEGLYDIKRSQHKTKTIRE